MKGEESMEIGLIFKIAAVGIIVSVIGQILKHSGRGGTGISYKFGGINISSYVDCTLYI